MTVQDLLSLAEWDEFEIDGEMYFSAYSAIQICGDYQVKMWYPFIYQSGVGSEEPAVTIKIQTV